jgi:hypothetical protein
MRHRSGTASGKHNGLAKADLSLLIGAKSYRELRIAL